MTRLIWATTALAGVLFAATGAWAQSTGTKTVEEVVVTAKKISLDGVLTAQEAPKTRDVITQQYLATQPPGQNVINDLNLVPGLNFTNEDPFGMAGSNGHLRIRGIDGSRISLLIDGVPLNDTGNYAIYPGELVDSEVIASANVNTGSTDTDSPTASAVGGLININTLTPTDKMGGFVQGSGGSDSYRRIVALFNTGEVGPWGTKAWVEASDQQYDKFKGFGDFEKWQLNGKVYQDLHHDGDFIALAGFYDKQLIHNIYGLDLKTFGSHAQPADPWGTDYIGTYFSAGKTPGTAGNDNAGTCAFSPAVAPSSPTATCQGTNYFGNQLNPTITGNLRGESKFSLLPNLHLTIDPAFQYVLADGGTQTTTIKENDPRLTGSGVTAGGVKTKLPVCFSGGVVNGVDLNGDGDCLDTVRLYDPSVTETNRYTLNSSLIWDINDTNLIRISYAYDHGNHRQSGEYTFLDASGVPLNPYGGKDGQGPKIRGADGEILQRRDRLSIAELQQFSAEYVGRFFDERLRVDLGVRDPHFTRDLNQFCYTSGSNGSSVYCIDNAAVANGMGFTIAPFKAHVEYTKVLPNVGLSWRFDANNMVYFTYSQELSAPRTDDLYTVCSKTACPTAVTLDTVRPETSTTYEVGYRYQTSRMIGTLDAYQSTYQNRIVSTFDPLTGVSDDRNVGDVDFYGVEGQFGIKATEHLTLTASGSYTHSELQSNLQFNATTIEPLKGKQLVETPEWMFGGRATYEMGPWVFGLQTKWVDKRYVTDVNDLSVPAYQTWDMDIRYRLDAILPGSYLQMNAINILDKKYFGSLGTTASANTSLPYGSSQPFAYQGAPTTVWFTLRAAF